MFIKNSLSAQRFQPAKKAAATPKQESKQAPKEPSLGAQYADTLVRANDNLLPNLSAIGLGFVGATKGIELGSNFGPIGSVIGAVAGVAGGAYLGHTVASGLNNSLNSIIADDFGNASVGAKATAKTVYGALTFGAAGVIASVASGDVAGAVTGGLTGAAIYGAVALGGAGITLRDEIVAKSLPKDLEPGPFRI